VRKEPTVEKSFPVPESHSNSHFHFLIYSRTPRETPIARGTLMSTKIKYFNRHDEYGEHVNSSRPPFKVIEDDSLQLPEDKVRINYQRRSTTANSTGEADEATA
jgi:hypothetical protein